MNDHPPLTLTHWPLVIATYSAAMTLDDYRAQLAQWHAWLATGERFAVLRVFATSEALTHPEGSAQLSKQWLQDTRPRLQQSVLGMATVVPPAHYEQLQRMQMEKAFGVPGKVFQHVDDALAWLGNEVLAPAGLEMPAVQMPGG
jgi:hypothetical protein